MLRGKQEWGIRDAACGVMKDGKLDFAEIDPLFFDEAKVRAIPKSYIHCRKSEFLAVGKCAYARVIKNIRIDHWTCYELDSPHDCMKAVPEQVVAILLGKSPSLVVGKRS